jgi:heme/copper-type cytochrome/quinol oxidase subunit 2
MVLKDSLDTLNNLSNTAPFNLTLLNKHLFSYLVGGESSTPSVSQNTELYKSQYRPMKKGVTNMIRLHATGAVAMPIEIRLHILASSKDVIHSWAIPSAGIKIDCVPGYSSHRITTFLVSGIF